MPPPLQSHHFLAVIGSADRVGQVPGGNSHRQCTVLDGKLVFRFSQVHVVADIKDPLLPGKFRLAEITGGLQFFHVPTWHKQFEFDRAATRTHLRCPEAERFHARKNTRFLAPGRNQLLAGHRPVLQVNQFHVHHTDMRTIGALVGPHRLGDGNVSHRPVMQSQKGTVRREFFFCPQDSRFQFPGCRIGKIRRGSLRENHLGPDQRAIDLGKNNERGYTGLDRHHCDHQQGDSTDHEHPGTLQAPAHDGQVKPFHHETQAATGPDVDPVKDNLDEPEGKEEKSK